MMAKEKELEKKRKAAAVAAKKAKEAMALSEKLAAEVLALEKEVSTVSVSSTEAGPPAKKDVQAKKDSSSDSSDSENDSEDSDEQEAPKNVASKTKEVEATKETNKKDEDSNDSSSDSDSSSSSSSSDDDTDKVKETETVDAKKAETKADKENDDESSGSSSDSDSDSGDDEDGDKEEMKQTDGKEGKTKTKLADVKATPVKEASGNKRGASAFSPEDDKRQATTKIYVRGLPWRASEEEIREYFMACGEIESLELPLQDDGRSSGTAVITFKEAAGSSAAIELNGSDFQGRWLSIKYSTPKPTMTPKSTSEKPTDCKTIFVGNLSFQIDEDTLRDAFKECGEISMVRFATDRETGDFKGFGHIEFVDSDAVDKAMAMAGTEILGRAVRIDFAEDKRRGSFGDRGGGGGRGRFGGGGGRAEYMGKGGGGRKGSGRQGRGRGDSRSGGGMAKAKKTGAIAEFSGSKITF